MTNFDHYAAAEKLAKALETDGFPDLAKELRNVIAEGSTGTEIFMGLHWHLQRIQRSEIPISDETRRQLNELVLELAKELT